MLDFVWLQCFKVSNLSYVKHEVISKKEISTGYTEILYDLDIVNSLNDSDLLYCVCDGNGVGESYTMINPISVFRNGVGTLKPMVSYIDANRTCLAYVSLTNSGLIIGTTNSSQNIFLNYYCIVRGV